MVRVQVLWTKTKPQMILPGECIIIGVTKNLSEQMAVGLYYKAVIVQSKPT